MKQVLFEGGIFAFDPCSIDRFTPTNEVSTCCIVCNEQILLLKRNNSGTAGGKWCMPGGKLEKNETPMQAVIREVTEETGIILLPEEVNFFQTICIRALAPQKDYVLHLFKAVFPNTQPSQYNVVLNQEHTDFLWANLISAKELNLVAGSNEILDFLHDPLMFQHM